MHYHDDSVDRAVILQTNNPSDWRLEARGFNPTRGRQHSFVEIDHESEGQLSVSGKRMCTILVNRLED